MKQIPRPLPYVLLCLLSCSLLIGSSAGAAARRDDRFLAGYASAVLELRFGLHIPHLAVQDGRLVLDRAQLQGRDPRRVLAALNAIDGLQAELGAARTSQPSTPATNAGSAPPHVVTSAPTRTTAPSPGPSADEAALGVLPPRNLFAPLLADPRWPHFATEYQAYQGERELRNVAAVSVGGSLPFYGWRTALGDWQAGVQAGVFSIFDLDGPSSDLINTDFIVGLPLSFHRGRFSAQARLLHQSSHLGDEYVLRHDVTRVNLSYEALDTLFSYRPYSWLRLYGGGGAILRSSPNLGRGRLQGGVELASPTPVLDPHLFPVAAVDVQSHQATDWSPALSLRTGLEIRSDALGARRLEVLLEYFNGPSPNGQFYNDSIEYIGAGVHFHF